MNTEVPKYIANLFKPRVQGKVKSSRRVWGLDLETFWTPVLTAANTVGLTDIPSDALGAPLRLNRAKDGSVRFSQSGRPSLSVAKPIREAVKTAQENFEAENLRFVAQVRKDRKEEYQAEVTAAQKAGRPILEMQEKDIADAVAEMNAQTVQEAEAEAPQTAEAVPAAA